MSSSHLKLGKNRSKQILLSETQYFKKAGFSGQVYVPSDAKVGFNALLVTVDGRHPRKRMVDTTRVYFVVSGTGLFVLNEEKYKAEKGNVYVILPGSEYEYSGKMELFEFNVSPTNSFKDELV